MNPPHLPPQHNLKLFHFDKIFLPVKLKIDRAAELLDNLIPVLTNFKNNQSKNICIHPEWTDDGRQYSLIASGNITTPPELSLYIGEIIHQLRSSLDHLVCALASYNGASIKKSHQYPICKTQADFETAKSKGRLSGLSKPAALEIETSQPYNNTANLTSDILYVLNDLSNTDKHRSLLLTVCAAKMGDTVNIGNSNPHDHPTIVNMSTPDPVLLTTDGLPIFSIGLLEPTPSFYATIETNIIIGLHDVYPTNIIPVEEVLSLTIKRVLELFGAIITKSTTPTSPIL
jgi:hypothetical protein